jgi:hypothetical protein
MSVDTRQALRLVSCLANPSAMQDARWGSVDTTRYTSKNMTNSIIGGPFHNI